MSRALDMRLAGATYADIATALSISAPAARRRVLRDVDDIRGRIGGWLALGRFRIHDLLTCTCQVCAAERRISRVRYK